MRKSEQSKEEKREKPPRVPKIKTVKEKRHKPPGNFKETVGDFFRNRLVIGFICVIVALLISFVAVPVVQGMVSERVPVLVAASDIRRGTLITPELVRVSDIGVIDRPGGAAVSADQVVGTFASIDMLQGDMVTSGKLAKERPLSNPYLYDLPDGKLAISVSVKGLAEGLTGKLKAGDVVSVYAVFNESNAQENYSAILPPELKYVQVLAVSNSAGADLDADIQKIDTESKNENLPATITLMAGDIQAAALAGLDRNSTIHVGLVARSDNTGLCETLLRQQDEYIVETVARTRFLNGEEVGNG